MRIYSRWGRRLQRRILKLAGNWRNRLELRGGTGKAGRVATSTAVGAGAGAAAGAVGGAISGSVGYGAMIGAATGAVWGFLMGLFRESRSPQQNQAYTNFVNRCLQEKGYEVTGWQ